MGRATARLGLGLALALWSPPARATFHLWRVNEVFSNADGSVQFVEFFTASAFQNFLAGHSMQALAGSTPLATFDFDTSLDLNQNTQDRFFVVGTAAFEAAAGIAPDYVMPDHFLDPALVDSVTIVNADPSTPFSFAAGSIPTDGTNSLDRTTGVGPATPTNFAGLTGTIPEPGAGSAGLAATLALAVLACRRATGRSPSGAGAGG
jgi:hypothetical protein